MFQYVLDGHQLSYTCRSLLNLLVAVFDVTQLSPPRPTVSELNEDGMPVNQPNQHVPTGTLENANCCKMHSVAKLRNVVRQTQTSMLERPRSSGSSSVTKRAARKGRQTIDAMLCAAGPASRQVGVKEKDQFMELLDATNQAASLELGLQVGKVMREAREAV